MHLTGRLLVCVPTTLPAVFPDDRHGVCAICGQAVRFRPHAPAESTLLCVRCYLVHVDPDTPCELTSESIDELNAWLAAPESDR